MDVQAAKPGIVNSLAKKASQPLRPSLRENLVYMKNVFFKIKLIFGLTDDGSGKCLQPSNGILCHIIIGLILAPDQGPVSCLKTGKINMKIRENKRKTKKTREK